MIALVGQRDYPTDAIRDYCAELAAALARRGVYLEVAEIWGHHERASGHSLRPLQERCGAWTGRWVLVQYTHMAWPARGFPFGLLRVLRLLMRVGARVLLTFHDPLPFPGEQVRVRLRRSAQGLVMRQAARQAAALVSTVAPACVPWMREPGVREKVALIPVGSNIPEHWQEATHVESSVPTVVVFGVTNGSAAEAALLADVVQRASREIGAIHLMVVGRGSSEAAAALHAAVEGTRVMATAHGMLPAVDVSELLSRAHVQLFVRGGVSTRRGSAIAGLGCGLPIVAYAGPETAFPITEAGVRLVPDGDVSGLAEELASVLGDSELRARLSERSREAMRRYFSWDAIASRYQQLLGAQS